MSSSLRPALSAEGLREHLAGLPWADVEVVATTGSTNADVMVQAAAGAAEGLVIAAGEQTAGRGRLGRNWVSPPGSSVAVSVLLRPAMSGEQLGWLPLLTGLAVASAVTQTCSVAAALKWPNDVLVTSGRPGKIAGVLLERSGDAAVVGFGINTTMTEEEFPVEQASSILLAGGSALDPDALVAACLRNLFARYDRLRACGGDADRSGLADDYSANCATIGRGVEVALPDGQTLRGTAESVDSSGRLVVRAETGPVAVSAGDVTHVR